VAWREKKATCRGGRCFPAPRLRALAQPAHNGLPPLPLSYVAAPDGASLRCADLRDRLLSTGGESGDASSPPPPCPPAATLTLDRPLAFRPLHFALSPDGRRAALAGPTTSDPDVYAARLVDLSQQPGGGADTPTPLESAPLAAALFAARPGLRVLQVAWHPASPRHVALLTSDATLRLYDAASAAGAPEQSVELGPFRGGGGNNGGPARRGGFGLGPPADGGGGPARPTPAAFAFGRGGVWERFTLYVGDTAGGLWSLCPLAPWGAGLAEAEVVALAASVAAPSAPPDARDWVAAALPDRPDGSPARAVAPHALPAASPALVGPWPFCAPPPPGATLAPAPPATRGFLTASPRTDDALASLVWVGLPPSPAAALVAGSKGGWLGLAALAGPAGPAWAAAAPRVALPASDDEEEEGEYEDAPFNRPAIAAVESVARGVAPDPQAGRRALLLDAVHLAGCGEGAPDEDEGGDGDGDGDGGDGGPPPSSSSAPLLLPDPADPARLYAVVGGGRGGAAGRAGPSVSAVDVSWLASLGGGAPPPARLPPVAVTPLVTVDCDWAAGDDGGGAVILGAAAVGAPPADGGLVLVVGGCGARPAPPEARLLRAPRAAGAGGAGWGRLASTTTTVVAPGAPAEDLAGIAAGLPARPPPPLPSSSADPTTPAGAAALASRAAALTDGPVAFIQDAAAVLAGRAEALAVASDVAAGRAAALAAGAAAVSAAGGCLAPRLAAAASLQANLEARSRLLARLRWSRPAPLTEGEAAFREGELPALEAAVAGLAGEAASLAARAAGLRESGGGEDEDGFVHVLTPPAPVPPPPAVPAGELRAAKAAAARQGAALRLAAGGLDAVERAVGEAEVAVARARGEL